MWQFEHTLTTEAKLETIWALYSDISTWVEWDKGIEHASLEGPFAAGTRGLLQPQGQERLSFQLTEIDPLRGFSDVTDIPDAGIEIRFSHRLEPVAGGTRITHRVTITGANSDGLGSELGADLLQGIPQTMERLASLALERQQQHAD